MTVAVCVVAYNEENAIDNLIEDIIAQDYPHTSMEIVLVDSVSTDETKKKMEQFSLQNEKYGFQRILVLDNPKHSQAAGWNVAIRNTTNDVIIRIDAHASIPKEFVRKQMECQESGEYITGGPRPNIIDSPTAWKETLFLAESSMFGSSIAPYRRDAKRTYVKSMFHAAYRREVFVKAGMFNENLGRTEDNEMHYRMRMAGYQFCYDPGIVSYQHIRSSLRGMLKQKYGNGLWIGKTVKICSSCLSIYHFVPFAFIVGIFVTTLFYIANFPWLAILMWTAYIVLAFIMSMVAIIGRKQFYISDLLLPVLFFLLHISYGIGTAIGLISQKPGTEGSDKDALIN